MILIISSVYSHYISSAPFFEDLEVAFQYSSSICSRNSLWSSLVKDSLELLGHSCKILLSNLELYSNPSQFYAFIKNALTIYPISHVINEHPPSFSFDFLSSIKRHHPNVKLIVHSCARSNLTYGLDHYDYILACSPAFSVGLPKNKVIDFYHASPGYIFNYYKPRLIERQQKCSFFGSFFPSVHMKRKKLINYLLKKHAPIDVFSDVRASSLSAILSRKLKFPSYISESLMYIASIFSGPVFKQSRPPCFGESFNKSFSSYLCSLNVHADFANGFSANMRLFEAAAMGVCLITESFPNIHELFEPDVEILTYSSFDECYEKITYCIAHPSVAMEIGNQARLRAMSSHTFQDRIKLLPL